MTFFSFFSLCLVVYFPIIIHSLISIFSLSLGLSLSFCQAEVRELRTRLAELEARSAALDKRIAREEQQQELEEVEGPVLRSCTSAHLRQMGRALEDLLGSEHRTHICLSPPPLLQRWGAALGQIATRGCHRVSKAFTRKDSLSVRTGIEKSLLLFHLLMVERENLKSSKTVRNREGL